MKFKFAFEYKYNFDKFEVYVLKDTINFKLIFFFFFMSNNLFPSSEILDKIIKFNKYVINMSLYLIIYQ